MSVVDKTCRGCKHLRTGSSTTSTSLYTCNYFVDTGHLRGCPAGKGCIRHTGRQKGRKAKEGRA